MEQTHLALLRAELQRDEGVRLKPYRDAAGKLTIGVGRNLDDVGISPPESRVLLDNDIWQAIEQLNQRLPWWRALDPVRQRVLANMCFNMGIDALCTFRQTLPLIQGGQYEQASVCMLQSKWAVQVGARAVRLGHAMKTGQMP